MEWWTWLLIGVLAVAVVLWVASAARRRRLRAAFGDEYDRAVESASSRRDAERNLRDRLRRHRALELQPLEPDVAAQYAAEWMDVQIKFVDAPEEACNDAEQLLGRVLRARGYPVDEDFESQADLVSVDHPALVTQYRRAHETLHGREGPGRLEDLRVAFIAYRGMFSDLLGDQHPTPRDEPPREEDPVREEPVGEDRDVA
jgi:hypothetical protein